MNTCTAGRLAGLLLPLSLFAGMVSYTPENLVSLKTSFNERLLDLATCRRSECVWRFQRCNMYYSTTSCDNIVSFNTHKSSIAIICQLPSFFVQVVV